MVERRVCSFCGEEIEPGTGRMYVKKDGTIYSFCTHKCYQNMIELRRVPRTTLWTRAARSQRARPGKGVSRPTPAPEEAAEAEVKEEGAEAKPEEEAPAEKPKPKAKKVKRSAPKAKKEAEG